MKILDKKLGEVLVDAELWAFLEANIGNSVSPCDLPENVNYFDFNENAEYMGMAKIYFPAYENDPLENWTAFKKWIDLLPSEAETIFDREDIDTAISSEKLTPKDIFKSFGSLKETLTQEIASSTGLEYALACVEVLYEDKSLHIIFTNLDWPDVWPFEVVRTSNGSPDCNNCYYFEPSYE